MKLRMTLLLFVGMMMSTTAFGQSTKDAWDDILWDIELGVGTKYKGLQQANWSLDLGYKIADLFYPYVRTERSLMLYKRDGVKTYGNTWNIGGGAGFIVYKGVDKHDKEPFTIEVTGNVTTSVGNYDYKNTSYYGGVRLRSDGVFLSLGYRYMSAHGHEFHNYSAFVISIGF